MRKEQVTKLKRRFFQRPTTLVAKELLGKVIVRRVGRKLIRGRIVETEAYCGEEDLACHARVGRTKRNAVMYGRAGHAYIYLCYGIHELLNIVTREKDCPEAVLIRGIVEGAPCLRQAPKLGALQKRCTFCGASRLSRSILPRRSRLFRLGPGKLTKYLKITRKLNGEDLAKSKKLWVEDEGFVVKKSQIKSAERIGVSYAGKWIKKKWRYFLNEKFKT